MTAANDLIPFQEKARNICHQGRFFFVHNPKAAGTSMRSWLALNQQNPTTNTLFEKTIHPKTWESYFTFMVCRNPYDRLVSYYHYSQRQAAFEGDYIGEVVSRFSWARQLSIRAFFEVAVAIAAKVQRPQVCWARHLDSDKPVDYVIRFEDLAKDSVNEIRKLKERCAGLRNKPDEFPHVNKSRLQGGCNWRDYFKDAEFLRMVNDYYAEDFEFFGYEREVTL